MSVGEEFRPILHARARGPGHLGFLEPDLCERAMELILSGEATPAQIGGFLLVGRAVGDSAPELAAYARPMRSIARPIEAPLGSPVVTVTGGFDGKLRTFNVGAAASLVAAAAAGSRVLMLGCEGTPRRSVGRSSTPCETWEFLRRRPWKRPKFPFRSAASRPRARPTSCPSSTPSWGSATRWCAGRS